MNKKNKKNSRRQMHLMQVREEAKEKDGFSSIFFKTSRGEIEGRFYSVESASLGAIFLAGDSGDWESPTRQSYPELCKRLQGSGIASLHIRYRKPFDLEEASYDSNKALCFLESKGIKKIAVIGHSFGGAVALRTAIDNQSVKAVVALATQSLGVGAIDAFNHRCALLLLHGMGDEIVPKSTSEFIFSLARDPKKMIFYPDNSHGLDAFADDIENTIHAWINKYLEANHTGDLENQKPPFTIRSRK